MSWEAYLQFFEKGEPAGVPRAAVRAHFPVVEEASERDYWHVRYGDAGDGNDCNIGVSALAGDPERVEGLTVFRPIAEPRLWDALAAVLKMGNGVLYAPGAERPLVAHGSVDEHLPPEMIRALGYPQAVNFGVEIREAWDPENAFVSPETLLDHVTDRESFCRSRGRSPPSAPAPRTSRRGSHSGTASTARSGGTTA